ncbi:hypothetical protein STRTUCAR8_08073, partial [Streptomyces turgidiscabies Car8]
MRRSERFSGPWLQWSLMDRERP